MFRVLHLVRRREGMSAGDFERYWRDIHVPITLAHPLLREYRVGLAREWNDGPHFDFDGYALLGYGSRADWEADGGTVESAISREDADRFLSMNQSVVVDETIYRINDSVGESPGLVR